MNKLNAIVSPTSIRLWILKDVCGRVGVRSLVTRFTHLDPFVDTESGTTAQTPARLPRFTHLDPFVDTERLAMALAAVTAVAVFHPPRSVCGY